MRQSTQSTVYTVIANCQDCYRCVRACPVKAIQVRGGQARVEDDLCIRCGTCVKECPQHAKTIISSLDEVKALIQSDKKVVASIAPSFAAMLTKEYIKRLPSALRQLGFSHVSETAEGAKYITGKSLPNTSAGSVCTACPAVVNYIEKYKPQLLDLLIPVVSPMVAHGRLLKANYPGCAVVFIGPCAAKKYEAQRPENTDAIDAVLTFTELQQWLQEEDINLAHCSESSFENLGEIGDGRLFPIQGGMLKTAGIVCDGTNLDVIHISGHDEVMNLFEIDPSEWDYKFVEPLFCKSGCINGPAFQSDSTIFERRDNIITYNQKMAPSDNIKKKTDIDHTATFAQDTPKLMEVTESQINKIFECTGKVDPELRLNCGACGYENCRDNAIAVARGMADPEMCMPYMRRLAQQRTDKIIETAPYGIVVLDHELSIIKMNPAFQKMFMCNNGILGRRISYLLNAEGFEKVHSGIVDQYEAIQTKYGIRYHEILYALPEERQFIGVYSNISKIKYDNNQLDVIKTQTLDQARKFLDHQIRFAQEMAHYLGKSTAESEEIAKKIISLYEETDNTEQPS